MSELKEHIFCDFDEVFPRGYCGPLLSQEARPYYLKSEADKVFAEKDKEIQRLENLCESYRIDCDNLAIREANAYKEVERNNKQLRNQKYKRCLAIADFCESQCDYYNTLGNGFWLVRGDIETRDKYRKKASDFWWKWHKRWFELAEKFKPTNSTAQ